MRSVRNTLIAAVTSLGFAAAASADTPVSFALDWKFDGPSAPYLVALDRGYYKAEGLDVTIVPTPGSVAGIARVAAGTHQFGFFDLNSLVRFRDRNRGQDVKAVLMVYDRPPFAIITLARTGIDKPKDLEGRVLGAPAPDGAFAQWKALAKFNGIDTAKVTIDNVGFPLREPLLAAGEVDAITGYSFSSYFNLLQKGVLPAEIKVLLMCDFGLLLYGNAIMVNPEFARHSPNLVAGFVRATIKGMQETVKDPDAAIGSVLERNEIADRVIELERLQMAIRDNIATPWVKANGFGGIDPARLAASIEQIALGYDFRAKPRAADVFTGEFLPPAPERMLP
jgi:NitT/TauT family transport system substrate-binding protein